MDNNDWQIVGAVAIAWLVIGAYWWAVNGYLATEKNRCAAAWAWVSLVAGPLGLLLYLPIAAAPKKEN